MALATHRRIPCCQVLLRTSDSIANRTRAKSHSPYDQDPKHVPNDVCSDAQVHSVENATLMHSSLDPIAFPQKRLESSCLGQPYLTSMLRVSKVLLATLPSWRNQSNVSWAIPSGALHCQRVLSAPRHCGNLKSPQENRQSRRTRIKRDRKPSAKNTLSEEHGLPKWSVPGTRPDNIT